MNSTEKRVYRFACKFARKLSKKNYKPETIKRSLEINYPSIDANEILALVNEFSEDA